MIAQFVEQLNRYGQAGTPCLFLLDFELQRPRLWRLADLSPEQVRYYFNGQSNAPAALSLSPHIVADLHPYPIARDQYRTAFERVQKGLRYGDSFLCNLTFPTAIRPAATLPELFAAVQARYRLWVRDELLCFSPEIFVRISDNTIHSNPMKGTQPARQPGDEQRLLDSAKERAEHATIVDLIRNDLSTVARQVRVKRYRYLDQLLTSRGPLWQTSTHITGQLPTDWRSHLGDTLLRLLPAGSVSGAPKPKTLELIRAAEGRPRGYYTGIAGLYDGQSLDSCVLIRFIEQDMSGALRYWSGGGITAQSNWAEEYEEMVQKVYLPLASAIKETS